MNNKINYWVIPTLEVKNCNDYTKRVCQKFNVTEKQIKGDSRVQEIAEPRAILSYLLHKRLKMSSIAVGKYLNRNHATVLHLCKKVENYMSYDNEYKIKVNQFM